MSIKFAPDFYACCSSALLNCNCKNPFKIASGDGILALLNHFLTVCAAYAQTWAELLVTHTVIKHIMAILISAFLISYKGKTVHFAKCSPYHRIIIAYFLNKGKWNDSLLADSLKAAVIQAVYSQASKTGKPVFCIVDDTISSKTKPSSRALHPIEDAYFHHSHRKKKQDYGHQAVAVMLSCDGLVLNYAVVMYDKSRSKVDLVRDIARELPPPPTLSYLLCDSWYTNRKVMDAFLMKGFCTIGALKTNRVLYPCGIRCRLSDFALVTVQYLHSHDSQTHENQFR